MKALEGQRVAKWHAEEAKHRATVQIALAEGEAFNAISAASQHMQQQVEARLQQELQQKQMDMQQLATQHQQQLQDVSQKYQQRILQMQQQIQQQDVLAGRVELLTSKNNMLTSEVEARSADVFDHAAL